MSTTTFTRTENTSPRSDADVAAILAEPGFGRHFTDHMVTIHWTEGEGWHDAQVRPYGPIPLDPATNVLHYGQEIFEGLKAYRQADGSIDSRYVPDAHEASLYLRPFMIATEVGLGVRPSNDYLYVLIASPVGAYFKGGIQPVSVWLSTEYVRAAPGGTGEAKCAGNYAASLVAQASAAAQGCDQVVFLDAAERRWVEELGGMNVFFVFDDGALATPPLTGTILPGITRDSLITLARAAGMDVREEPYSIDQWRADAASGRLAECFACGTAAVITPIGQIKSPDGAFAIGDGDKAGPVTARLRKTLTDIQRGAAPDPYGWVQKVF